MSAADLLNALWRKRAWVWIPTLVVAVVTYAYLITATPLYMSEARILVEDTQSVFSRTERETEEREADPAGVASHVQLLLARDLARTVIADLNLTQYAEFDSLKDGLSIPTRLLILLGLVPDPHRMSAEERALREFADLLRVFQVDNSRVIAVRFSSRDPERAATVVNAVADHYIRRQQEARRQSTLQATTWLGAQIEDLRTNVEDAESKVEAFRAAHGLQRGAADAPLPGTQLSDLSTRLAALRAQHAEAKARAQLIRDELAKGTDLSSLSDVLNSQVIQRLIEQRVTLQRRVAELSSTLLPQHPRMRELNAELADMQNQMRAEAEKVIRSLESEASIAAASEQAVRVSLDQLKAETGQNNHNEVELRSLEREAAAQRQILENFLARYSEANARQAGEAAPAQARIISRGSPTNEPSYPQKLPIFMLALVSTLLLSATAVLSSELMQATSLERRWPASGGEPEFDMAGQGEGTALPSPHGAGFHSGLHAASRTGQTVGSAGHYRARSGAAMIPGAAPDPAVAMAARDVVASLLARRFGADSLRVLVTSPQRMSERNFAAVNLARLMAREGLKVMLIDTNMRAPRLNRQLGLAQPRGLAELLHGECAFTEVIQRDTGSPAHVIAAGAARDTMLTLFEPQRLERVLDALEGSYGVIIVDAPPALLSGEAQMLANHVDAAVLLRDDLPGGASLDERAVRTLTRDGERPLAIVKSDATLAEPSPAGGHHPERDAA